MHTNLFRKTEPPISAIYDINLQDPIHFNLDNGVDVWGINFGELEVAKVDLLFDAGSVFGKNPLTSGFTNLCLREGTHNYTSDQIAEIIDNYGASIRLNSGRDSAGITLVCLTKYLKALIPLLSDIVLKPTFPEKELKTLTDRYRQNFMVDMEKEKVLSDRHFGKLAFGKNHIYHRYAKLEDYDNITPTDLIEFYEMFYKNSKFQIVISGLMPENIAELLNVYFGKHLIEENNIKPQGAYEAEPASGFHFFEKVNSLQSCINIGKPIFNIHHPDYIGMQVLNTMLGGYFGSRLMKNIREDKGYTYGINSFFLNLKFSGLFKIVTQVGAEVTKPAIDEIINEIERIRKAPAEEQELNLVKNYMLGNLLQLSDGSFGQSELLKTMLTFQKDISFYKKMITTIKSISKEEIQDLAVNYLDPNSMLSIVVGKKTE